MKKQVLFFATAVIMSMVTCFPQIETTIQPAVANCEEDTVFTITIISNPPELFEVKGIYPCGTIITICIPEYIQGYKFVNWLKNGIEISLERCCEFTITESCTLTANFELVTGIKIIVNNDVSTYPNPTTGELHVTCHASCVTDVEVFDIYGRRQNAESRMQKGESAENSSYALTLLRSYGLNISHLPAGIYFVRVTTEKGVVMKKVVKN
jgi:hypothetical protein